ncbi:TetR/AcrR family transcriptional regulator [Anaerococcus octavius]|uniref:TetR/AcrR family transcriptional regulator n=1 Tax=Anaerococcus octavius TaxID=54007 RepID=UPI0027B9785A|nr:TetR/AcrR family transcriptional regulator [Anaerococcus octavius]
METQNINNKKIEIMDAALKIFKEKGLENTSVRDIMAESGYGLGTFYLYYSDKNDLKEKIVLDKAMGIIINAKNCNGENLLGEDKLIKNANKDLYNEAIGENLSLLKFKSMLRKDTHKFTNQKIRPYFE